MYIYTILLSLYKQKNHVGLRPDHGTNEKVWKFSGKLDEYNGPIELVFHTLKKPSIKLY